MLRKKRQRGGWVERNVLNVMNEQGGEESE
jgi:hypothetical protein